MNVKCEVEVLRDNGYGKLSSSKKEAEVFMQKLNNIIYCYETYLSHSRISPTFFFLDHQI